MLYRCEAWSFILREERRLRIFENMILRRMFGPKRDENGEWRRLHNEELHCYTAQLIQSGSIDTVRRLRWGGQVARMEEGRNAFRILTGKRPLGRSRRRWESNIRRNLKEIGINTRNCVDAAQDRDYLGALVNAPFIQPPGSISHWVR